MMLPILLLTALGALTATAIPTASSPVDAVSVLAARAVSPDTTCGNLKAGANKGYTCPGTAACCSSYGYCGTASDFCLTTAGCQAQFSNSSSACHAPKSGVDVTIDGTCGSTGVGKLGYRCAANGTFSACCSASGYCGNSTDHCDVNAGCQTGFGTCTGTKKAVPRNMVDVAKHLLGGN